MKNLFITLFILCFTGCVPPQETETKWKSDPEYRAFIATRMAESIINYQKNNIDEETVEELCDGSGWIVHGDGHKTECPGCPACESNEYDQTIDWSVEPILNTSEVLKEFEISTKQEEPTEQKSEVQDDVLPESKPVAQQRKKGIIKRAFGR